jgi:DDE superfamily endonuclease
VAGRDLGEGTRLAAATGAWICFEDEAGQAMRPPRARTWGRRGRTPVVRVSGKGSGRVSVAGLACLKPGEPSRFFFRLRLHRGRKGERRSMSEADYAALVTAAHHALGAPVILVWDNLNTHRSKAMRKLIAAQASWLTVIQLPAYAPDLNPVGRLVQHEERPGQPRCPHPRPARRGSTEPPPAHPAPARPHHRAPRPDGPHARIPAR